jgi:four helix bundle protein
VQRFTEIEAWRMAHDAIVELYKVTRGFPVDERFGMTSQVRRAAVSVAANIAEGSKRVNRTDYARFLNIAEGSAAEVQCELILSRSLDFAPPKKLNDLIASFDKIGGKLFNLRQSVERFTSSPPTRRVKDARRLRSQRRRRPTHHRAS